MQSYMRAVAAGVTDVGKERDHNEDRFLLLPEFDVFAVADGMGGHQCGEVASRMATATIAHFFRTKREHNGRTDDVLRESLLEANERINQRATASPVHRGMGTTVVAAAFDRDAQKLFVAHAGDSRCYRMRTSDLSQVTRDHSLVEEALRSRPDISKSELAYLPANVITRALGVEKSLDVDLNTQQVELGDVFLLCSDGLHGFVSDDKIHEIIISTNVLTTACAELVNEANLNGGGDNITVVLVRIEEAEDPWAVSTSVPPPPSALPSDMPSRMPCAPLPDMSDLAGQPDDTERMQPLTMAAAVATLEEDDTTKIPALSDEDDDLFDDENEDSLPPPPTSAPPDYD